METTSANPTKTTGKSTGLMLFALVIIAAVMIAFTAVSDVTANRVSASTAQANATRIARCGMDEQTYMVQLPAAARQDLESRALCSAPAELQP